MTDNTKLTKVLEYLIKNQEDKAKELLHQVFIEKARAIHEELMSEDDMSEEHMDEEEMSEEHAHDMEIDEASDSDLGGAPPGYKDYAGDDEVDVVGGSGDMGKDMTDDIESMDHEIDMEEMMNEVEDTEVTDTEVDSDGDMETMDRTEVKSDGADMTKVEDKMSEVEAALSAIRAELEKINADDDNEEEVSDTETKVDADVKDADEDEDDDKKEEDASIEEEEMDETWNLDEDFDDLAESLDLEVVTKDMEKSQKTPKDAGSASSGMSTGDKAKSPVPASQTSRMGAKPVKTGEGPTHKGYNLEAAPKSDKLVGTDDNRRKTAEAGMKKMPKEGVPGAKLNHPEPAQGNKMSPLSKGGQNLKA